MKKHYYTEEILNICDKKHLTVEKIFSEILKIFPEAGKSSIYRNVERMGEEGCLKKVTGIGKKAYFEKNSGEHIHLIDEDSGKIMDLKGEIPIPEGFLPDNFKAGNVDLKIFGKFT